MSIEVMDRVTADLIADGCALTSLTELGLSFDEDQVAELCEVVRHDGFDPVAAANVDDMNNMKSMVIARGEDTLRLGTELVRPIMDELLISNPEALGKWSLYAFNRYDQVGGTFEPHMDPPGRLVVVASVVGVRSLGIYRKDPDQREDRPETFRVIDRHVLLNPGAIFLIDGEFGPPHEVRCLEAPSMAAVIDVPDVNLR